MSRRELVAASGRWGVVLWGLDASGDSPARAFYLEQSKGDQAKLAALFQRLADFGRIENREKFKQLGDLAKGEARSLWEFKSFQLRFLGNFRPGYRFVISWGLRKKADRLSPEDMQRAVKLLAEHDLANR